MAVPSLPSTGPAFGNLPARQLPLFNPDPAAVPGLELLAAAAASTEAQVTKGNNPPATHSTVIPQGPFNPMKVVKKILDLEFIEMSEVTIDDDITGTGRPAAPARLPVTDISQWLERYFLMAQLGSRKKPRSCFLTNAPSSEWSEITRGSSGWHTIGNIAVRP